MSTMSVANHRGSDLGQPRARTSDISQPVGMSSNGEADDSQEEGSELHLEGCCRREHVDWPGPETSDEDAGLAALIVKTNGRSPGVSGGRDNVENHAEHP